MLKFGKKLFIPKSSKRTNNGEISWSKNQCRAAIAYKNKDLNNLKPVRSPYNK